MIGIMRGELARLMKNRDAKSGPLLRKGQIVACVGSAILKGKGFTGSTRRERSNGTEVDAAGVGGGF